MKKVVLIATVIFIAISCVGCRLQEQSKSINDSSIDLEQYSILAQSLFTKYFPTDLADHWAKDVLSDFVKADIMNGYADSGKMRIKPNIPISRAEFAALLVRSLTLASSSSGKTFHDVHAGDWFYEPIRIASSLNIVDGTGENEFSPEKYIQRDEIAAMIVRAFSSTIPFEGPSKPFQDVPEYWGKQSVERASKAGIINGRTDHLFDPYANATRAEAAVMLHRALHKQNTNIPENHEIARNVFNDIHSAGTILREETYDHLYSLSELATTGFYKASTEAGIKKIIDAVKNGYKFNAFTRGSTSIWSYEKSNNFVSAEMRWQTYDFSYTNPDKNDSYRGIVDITGTYYLRKMHDGEWKIYRFEMQNRDQKLTVNPLELGSCIGLFYNQNFR